MSGYAILASRHAPHLVMFGVEPSMTESTYVRDKVAALDAELAPLNLSYAAARGAREEAGLLRNHLVGEEYYVSENIDDVARLANVQVTGQIVGGVDFAQLLKGPIFQLKVVSLAQAREMLAGGQEAIRQAKEIAKETWTKPALPGETSRDNVFWKLDWHDKKLAEMRQGSVNAVYPHGDDLKKWVLAAYSEWNAAEDGRGESERVAGKRLDDLGRRIAELPGVAVEAIRQLPGKVVESATGLPLWAWSLLAVGGVGLLGYGVVKILSAIAPAVAPAVAPAIVGIGVEEFQRRRRQAESQV